MFTKYRLKQSDADALRTVGWLAGIFLILTMGFALHRYFSFYVTTDHGIFNQVFWNGTQGRFFESSMSSVLSTNVVHDEELPQVFYHRLGQHFTPALLLWLPLYSLFPSPATLVVLQVALVTAGGIVLYFLARRSLPTQIAVWITLSYYAANAVIGPALGNFYDLCQLPLFLFGMLLALEARRWLWFWVLAGLVLAIREDTGVVLFSVGLYLLLSRRSPRAGLAVCLISVGYIVGVTNVVMPLFSQDISRRFMIERFGQFVDDQEATTLQIVWAMLQNPGLLVQELVTPVKRTLLYLVGHWLPLAFVPAIAPSTWIMTALPLTQIFLQEDTVPLSINVRYATAVIPGLFYGVILWWSHHQEWWKAGVRRFWAVCLALSLFFTFTSNPHRTWSFLLPDSFDPLIYVSLSRQWEHVSHIYPMLEQIPPDASVSASRYILAHLSNRRALLPFGRYPKLEYINDAGEVAEIDYIIADLWFPLQYQGAFKDARGEVQQYNRKLNDLLTIGAYGLLMFGDGVALAKRGVSSDPVALEAWQNFRRNL